MPRVNIYLPDELAEQVRALDLNVSAVAQAALAEEVARRNTSTWFANLRRPARSVPHGAVMEALDRAREEFGA